MNYTEALLRAIIELIGQCDTIEELRESVKRIMQDKSKHSDSTQKSAALHEKGGISHIQVRAHSLRCVL